MRCVQSRQCVRHSFQLKQVKALCDVCVVVTEVAEGDPINNDLFESVCFQLMQMQRESIPHHL